MSEEIRCAIALSYLTGVGPIRARRLLAHAGSYADAVVTDPAKLRELRVPDPAIRQLRDGTALRHADAELAFVERHGIRVLDCLADDYPRRLADRPDAPLVLFYRGRASLDPPRTVGIVGTRSPSSAGRDFCERLVEELAEYGVTVVSGLAYGIDVTAQRVCVRAARPTVGVVAHGLGEVYPAAHREVAREMTQHGGLLTEYPSGLRSRREFFPQRNRIIAAMSDALVVIESAERGGSMITANLAVGYDIPVFAVPGRPRDRMSRGCNLLIKNHRANLLEGVADIGYVLGWNAGDGGAPTGRANLLFQDFAPLERRVLDQLELRDELDLDELLVTLDLSSGQLATTLLELEFKGVVRSLPGKRYAIA